MVIPKQLRVPVVKGKERREKLEKMAKIIKQNITSKQVLKDSKTSIVVKEQKPAEYVPIYFQAELKKAKEDMGFWK